MFCDIFIQNREYDKMRIGLVITNIVSIVKYEERYEQLLGCMLRYRSFIYVLVNFIENSMEQVIFFRRIKG